MYVFKNIYFLFIWLCWVLLVACGIWLSDQGLNPGPCLQSDTGPPGKALCEFFKQAFSFEICIDSHAVAGHNAAKQGALSSTLRTGYPVSRTVTSCSVSRPVVSDSATPWTVAHQAPLSMGFSRQEYWRRLPCPAPGDLPHPGNEPGSPALQADSLLSESPRKSILLNKYD